MSKLSYHKWQNLIQKDSTIPCFKILHLNLLFGKKNNNARLSFPMLVIYSCRKNKTGEHPQKLQNFSEGQKDNRLFGKVMGDSHMVRISSWG